MMEVGSMDTVVQGWIQGGFDCMPETSQTFSFFVFVFWIFQPKNKMYMMKRYVPKWLLAG